MPFNLIRTLPVHRYAYYLFLGLLGSYSMMLSAEPLLFDDGRLKNRGLDAGLSHYFSHAARFSPGEYPVSWVINGRNKRQLMTRFNAQGEPCITLKHPEISDLRMSLIKDVWIIRRFIPQHSYRQTRIKIRLVLQFRHLR